MSQENHSRLVKFELNVLFMTWYQKICKRFFILFHPPRHRARKELRLHVDVEADGGVAADVGHGDAGLVVLHPEEVPSLEIFWVLHS